VSGDGLDEVVARLGIHLDDRTNLRAALTHPSYSLEQGGDDYERLEFLGDAVLGWAIAAHLYNAYPNLAEGLLTRMKVALTAGTTLAKVARSLGLGEALLLGRGATREVTRDSVLENAFEAVVAAVFLDAGPDAASAFILRVLGDRLDPETLLTTSADPKTRLQELTQSRGLGLPSYEIVAQTGPAHDPRFTAAVCVGRSVAGTGVGTSKQEAQQAAAAAALDVLTAPEDAG
jgi:ribonuclease-3